MDVIGVHGSMQMKVQRVTQLPEQPAKKRECTRDPEIPNKQE